jgi:protein TonB
MRARVLAASIVVAAAHAAPPAGAAGREAEEALAACRRAWERQEPLLAIPSCEKAVELDQKNAEPHFHLGLAHYALSAPGENADPASIEAHRKSGIESFRRYLALARASGENPANRPKAIGGILSLYVLGDEEDDAMLAWAEELAAEKKPAFIHLVTLAAVYSRHERWPEAERFAKKAVEAAPRSPDTCVGLATLYARPVWNGHRRFDEMIRTLERCARLAPRDPVAHFRLASMLWDKAYKDESLGAKARAAYVDRGLAHADNALAVDDGYMEAHVYKGLLLRLKAKDAGGEREQALYLERAAAESARAAALRESGAKLREDPYAAWFGAAMPAMRAGGPIAEPKLVSAVDPVYPELARQAKAQGTVIVECTVGVDGRVTDAKVLKSIPLLDQAALEAVRKRVYAPTTFEGIPVPVIVTVTLNFRLG